MGFWGNTAQQQAKPKKFINISADQVNSNQQAIPVKYLAGCTYVAGDYISPAYNPTTKAIKSGAGKSDSAITGYKYFADFALVFCMGGRNPVDGLFTVIIDSDIRWQGAISRTTTGSHPHKAILAVPIQDSDNLLGTLHLYWGTEDQPIDNVLLTPRETAVGGGSPLDQTTWPPNSGEVEAGDPDPYNGHYDQHPAYRGQCYGVFIDWKLGRDRTAVPNIQLELCRGCPAPWVSGGFAPSDAAGVNPIAVLYDWLTDTRFGMGLPDTSLNLSTFSNTYNQLEAQYARISPLITSQDDFRQIIAQLMEYYDGWIRTHNGFIEVGLWSHGTNIVSSATLTDDDLLAEPALEPQGWSTTSNEVTLVYKDRDHHYNDYVQNYRDANNFRITGMPRPETLQRPWITHATIAKFLVQQTGAIMALPYMQGTLTVKREWLDNHSILPGSIIEFDSGFYDLAFLLRIMEIEYGKDDAAAATLTVEWERSKWPSLYIPPPFQGPGGFVIGPRGLYASRITEVPYLIADHQFLTQIVPLAVRGEVNSQGFRVWASFDAGGTYQLVPSDSSTSSFTAFGVCAPGGDPNNWYFYLYGVGLDEVVSQTPADQANDTLLCFVDAEVISLGIIAPQGGGLYYGNFLRARLGTVQASHPTGNNMYFIFRDRLTVIDNANFVPGATVLFKLQPFTADVEIDLDSITPISYTISGFADIPAPVFSPAGTAFSTSITVALSSPPAGFTARYTANGTAATSMSSAWAGPVTLTGATTLRARFFAQSGRQSMETIAQYTLVTSGAPNPVCGAPTWTFSGSLTNTAGNITVTQTTSASTIYYSVNGGGYSTSASPLVVALACSSSGDTIEFYATASGYTDSPHTFVDNRGTSACAVPTLTITSGTQNYTSVTVTLADATSGATIYYSKNYGATTAYSGVITLACTSTGDHLEYWATKSGLSDSAHAAFDNTLSGAPTCHVPSAAVTSGTWGSGTVTLTITAVLPSTATIHYIKNSLPEVTGASPITGIVLVHYGTLEYWESAAGYADSNHVYVENGTAP